MIAKVGKTARSPVPSILDIARVCGMMPNDKITQSIVLGWTQQFRSSSPIRYAQDCLEVRAFDKETKSQPDMLMQVIEVHS